MFVQLGWRIHCLIHKFALCHTSRDLFLVNKLSDNLSSVKSFQETSLSSSRYRGVASVSSLYIGQATKSDNQTRREIFVYGIDPNQPAFNLPKVNQHLNELAKSSTVWPSWRTSSVWGCPTLLEKENPLSAQVNDFEIQIVGLFTLGVSFSAEGNLITSDSTFLRLFPAPS